MINLFSEKISVIFVIFNQTLYHHFLFLEQYEKQQYEREAYSLRNPFKSV